MHEHQSCKQILGELSDYVDGILSPELCAELEEHLAGCENCRIVVNTLQRTIEIYRETSPVEELPADTRNRLFCCLDLDEYLTDKGSKV